MDRNEVKGVNVQQLKEMMDNGDDFIIIDVREPDEREICSIGGINVPLGLIDKNTDKIPRDKPAVVMCRSGKRSYMAILFLQQEYEYDNLFNLNGGIVAYARDVDKSLTLY
ncbi:MULTISPECIES: rhodanese-like domain-containing protein [unclassified Aureispira]|uniref:rhodanese-like domain-containing protein n=1 Tax=unclassified Aureispira TaxID=2649989 RepID=UPI000696350E|nr:MULTISPECIES: rhodanese-like domain-containing protein [unclassified Aureispira]WMX12509.1 rhodanese-like domain-containing protein [Aureispira sp. CCB-E]